MKNSLTRSTAYPTTSNVVNVRFTERYFPYGRETNLWFLSYRDRGGEKKTFTSFQTRVSDREMDDNESDGEGD